MNKKYDNTEIQPSAVTLKPPETVQAARTDLTYHAVGWGSPLGSLWAPRAITGVSAALRSTLTDQSNIQRNTGTPKVSHDTAS